ncbi:MAG: hypothetical protein QM499_12820 [Flavobacteriaceae bacterium]
MKNKDSLLKVDEKNNIESLIELDENYMDISEIIKLRFTNYKGPDKFESKGFGEKKQQLIF